jgi:hypothetical protein
LRKSLRESVSYRAAQNVPDPFPGLGGKRKIVRFPGFFLLRGIQSEGITDEIQLLLVPGAELADQQVNTHPDPLDQGEGSVHRIRDKPSHFLASEHGHLS